MKGWQLKLSLKSLENKNKDNQDIPLKEKEPQLPKKPKPKNHAP